MASGSSTRSGTTSALAHGWAISVGDLDHAEDILAAVRVYAESRIRAEVGVWAERTIAVESTERTARPETFGQAASWANWAGDSELASRRVRQGITAAPEPRPPEHGPLLDGGPVLRGSANPRTGAVARRSTRPPRGRVRRPRHRGRLVGADQPCRASDGLPPSSGVCCPAWGRRRASSSSTD